MANWLVELVEIVVKLPYVNVLVIVCAHGQGPKQRVSEIIINENFIFDFTNHINY